MKQTAVEWLAKKIGKQVIPTGSKLAIEKLIEKAKELEKQQIEDTYTSSMFIVCLYKFKKKL
jgi:hypothetical protein